MFDAIPSPSLREALNGLGAEAGQVFMGHLLGGTSANYLSDWLKRAGHPVSPTTLKEVRRSLVREG